MTLTRPFLLALLGASLAQAGAPAPSVIQRGAYLVQVGGCNDCHTLPEGPWMVTMAATATAFAGPWGVSHAANLTPDKETGLGSWTEAQFLQMIRSGRHLGQGRPILPPMPVQGLRAATEADQKAIFAYLKSIPAISNRVPAAVEPVASH